ncbi:MAG: glycosyltransferase [Solirubrobacteraceae bacterium]|nr:glycosyltransferase [Solirubrobacteraceae bacterium]
MQASILIVLDGGAEQALRCLTSIASIEPGQPEHEVVVVDDASVGLEALLARLEGDVAIVRTPRREGFAAAATRGLAACRGDVVVALRGAAEVAPDFLAPLVAALEDPAVAAVTPITASAPQDPPVAAHAVALRRADVAALPPAPAGLEIAALCAERARAGRVEACPASVVAAPGRRTGGARRPIDPDHPEAVEVSIVIPTLDAAGERVRACVAAAQATTEAPHEIVVIDNGAPPQGFTAPVNAGLRAARGRYLVVLNDDVELLPGWWPPLRDALDAGAAVVFPLTIDGAMRHDFAAWCFALARETLEAYAVAPGEFLDPDLVVWYQDTDLLERLRRDGRPPMLVERSRIRHGLSQTVESEDPQLRAWIARRIAADRAAFERKHGAAVPGAAR